MNSRLFSCVKTYLFLRTGQKKILNSSICIVGCGGLGSSAAQYLLMTGIGNIMLIDNDDIEKIQNILCFVDIRDNVKYARFRFKNSGKITWQRKRFLPV